MTGNRARTAAASAAAITCAGIILTGCSNSSAPTDAMPSVIPTVVVGAPIAPTDTAPQPAIPPAPSENKPESDSAATPSITPVDPARYSAINNEVGWKSPTGNIYCKLGSTEFSSGCQATDAPVPDGADCDRPPFSADEMSKGFFLDPGTVTPMCFNQGAFGVENAQPLEYNTAISFNGYTCYSRVEAMICDAGGGHGFALSMQQATWK